MNNAEAEYFTKQFSSLLSSPNHRYLSWEHCYHVFSKERKSSCPNVDLLSLNLGFYLASWGMMRGSSELLQKDYKVHSGAIKLLLQEKYNSLWGKTWSNSTTDKNDLNLIFDSRGLIEELRQYYNAFKISPTDTLITKIILGTMGCVPAYDRFLKKGLGADKMTQKLGKKSMSQIIDKYGTSSGFKMPAFGSVYSTTYPQMKIVDCFYWQYGYYIDEIETATKWPIEITNTRLSPIVTEKLDKKKSGYFIKRSTVDLAKIVKKGWHIS